MNVTGMKDTWCYPCKSLYIPVTGVLSIHFFEVSVSVSENTGILNNFTCTKCGAETRPNKPYCTKCGNKVVDTCGECGSILVTGDAFCSGCGSKNTGRDLGCPSCKTPTKYRNQTFCTECGMLLIMQCASCGAPIDAQWNHCAHCGRKLDSDRVDIRTATRVKERMANVSDLSQSQGDSAEDHNKKGLDLFQNEEYASAIEEFRSAVQIDPDNPSYHCNLAVALDEDDQDEEALREYEVTLQLDPADTTALLSLGYMYSENEESEKAQQMWNRVIQLAPGTAEAKEASDNLSHQTEI